MTRKIWATKWSIPSTTRRSSTPNNSYHILSDINRLFTVASIILLSYFCRFISCKYFWFSGRYITWGRLCGWLRGWVPTSGGTIVRWNDRGIGWRMEKVFARFNIYFIIYNKTLRMYIYMAPYIWLLYICNSILFTVFLDHGHESKLCRFPSPVFGIVEAYQLSRN